MIENDQEIWWMHESRQSFEVIKNSIAKELIHGIPHFSKYFLIFSFASKHMVERVLLQKNHEGYEQPIAFYNKTLRDAPLKYNILDKQEYALVKALKYFRVYFLHSHIISHMPTSTMKDILTQLNLEGWRGKWIAILLEYDLEIKPMNLVKG